MALVTILGSSGFIGSHLVARVEALGHQCQRPGREDDIAAGDLGHVVYAIGLTADFRSRPFDTVQAHVCRLMQVLENGSFESFVYLSSTRLYGNSSGSAHEEDGILAHPSDPSDLYNLSKATGESLCLRASDKTKVARLSNVYGRDLFSRNFLTEIVASAVDDGVISLRSALDSAKDYISIESVVELLIPILFEGKERIYNVASGKNTTHGELVEAIKAITGCRVSVAPGSPVISFPEISTQRIDHEFGAGRKGDPVEDRDEFVRRYAGEIEEK